MSLESRPGKRGSPEQSWDFSTAERLRSVEYPRAVINHILILYIKGVSIQEALESAKQVLKGKLSREGMREFVNTVEEALDAILTTKNSLNQLTLPDKNIIFLGKEPGKTPLAQALEMYDAISCLFRIAPNKDLVSGVLGLFPRPSNYDPCRLEDAQKLFNKRPHLFGVLPSKPNTQSR